MRSHLLRRIRAKSNLGRKMANARWARDRELRGRLAALEAARRERLVVVLRDTETGEDRVFAWSRDIGAVLLRAVERGADL